MFLLLSEKAAVNSEEICSLFLELVKSVSSSVAKWGNWFIVTGIVINDVAT